MLLLEASDSQYSARIEHAAKEAGLAVQRLDNLEAAPSDATLIGVGPSVSDPFHVARHLRNIGGDALLVFFTASRSARDTLQAELIRDPFVCARYELIEIPDSPRQLAARMGRVVEHVRRQLHVVPTSRRRRRRPHPLSASGPQAALVHEPYLASVMAHANEAIFTTDEGGRVTTWNQAADDLFGFGPEFAVGQTVDFLDRPDASTRQLGAIARRVQASGVPERAELTCTTSRGTSIEVSASVAPVRDDQGTPLGVSCIVRDDTERQRLEHALRVATVEKNEFLAIMSHELRTPLTSILGYTDVLLRGLSGPLGPLTNRYLGNVRIAGDRLLELVNGLLDYTRLEAGAERVNLHPVSPIPLVKQSVGNFQPQAEGRQIDLRVIASESVGCIEADAEKIDHVLRSLLVNALKFTPSGGSIAVRVGRDPEAEDAVRVSVADSGIGLRNEQLQRVWERFYQGDASLTRPFGGMGLGLSIARQLVRLHGGTVGAESRGPGMGSTFWFSLPMVRNS